MSEIEEKRMIPTYQRYGIRVVKGRGSRVWDDKGKEYIDYMMGFGVGILGHSYPAVVNAIKSQLDQIYICHGSLYTEARERFLEALFRVVPAHLTRVFLSNSGAESVELALKLARKYTGRKGFVAFTNSYHGKTYGALSVTYSEKYKNGFGPFIEPVKFLKYGDVNALNEVDFSEYAGVIVEPIQGEAGILVPPDDFLPALEEKARAKGALLIVDEVQSGMGRTGKWWAHQHWGIRPDIMTAGKGIGGGIPMGATIVREDIANIMKVGEHSSTMGGNPLASAAGEATIKAVDGLLDNVRAKGEELMKGLSGINSRLVKEVRGKGLMIGIDLRIKFRDVLTEMLDLGLISLYSGLTTLRFLPPYIIDERDISESVEITAKALQKAEEKLRT